MVAGRLFQPGFDAIRFHKERRESRSFADQGRRGAVQTVVVGNEPTSHIGLLYTILVHRLGRGHGGLNRLRQPALEGLACG